MADELKNAPSVLWVLMFGDGSFHRVTDSERGAATWREQGRDVFEYRPAASVSAPSGAVDSEASRASFEAWFSYGTSSSHVMSRTSDGLYTFELVRHAWDSWQAALAWQASQGAAVESAHVEGSKDVIDLSSGLPVLTCPCGSCSKLRRDIKARPAAQASDADYASLLAGHDALATENASLRGNCTCMGQDAKHQARALKRAIRERDHLTSECAVSEHLRKGLAAQVEAMKAASPSPTCDVGHAHFTPFYLLANARRICSRSYIRNANWVLAMELFAVGSTSAKRICIEADIDPDATSIKRAARQETKP